jgi:hypothetical protein
MTITEPLKDALNLAHRYQQGELFRRYVTQRMWLIAPAAVLIVGTSLALALGIVMFVGGTRPLTVLLSLLLAPFVLAGSLFVQGYLFLSWLEGRSLALSLGHRVSKRRGKLVARLEKKLDVSLGEMPPVPWALAGIFLLLPLMALVLAAPKLACGVIVLQILAPIAFARLDRA